MSLDVTARAGRTPGAGAMVEFDALEARRLLSSVGPEPTGLPGVYHTTALLSEARQGFTVARVGDDVIFAGGDVPNAASGGAVMSSAVDVYDARTGQWSAGRLSEPREYIKAFTVGSVALFVGGSTRPYVISSSRTVDVFDAATGAWTHRTLSRSPETMTIRVVGTKVVFAGGSTINSQTGGLEGVRLSDAVDVYDSATGQWSSARLSVGREGSAALVVGSKLILAGGWTRSTDGTLVASDAVDIYDAASDTWSTARLSQARGYATGVVSGSRAIFRDGAIPTADGQETQSHVADVYDADTGTWTATTDDDPAVLHALWGQDGHTAAVSDGKVELYDATTGQWSQVATVPVGDYGSYYAIGPTVFAAVGDKVVVGTTNTYDNAKQVDVYDVTTGQWSSHQLADFHAEVDTIAGKVVFSGGSATDSGYSPSSVVEVYDPAGDTWSTGALDSYGLPGPIVGDRLSLQVGTGVSVYDAASGAVTSLGLSPPRAGTDLAEVSGEVLAVGGQYVPRRGDKYYTTTAVDLFGSSPIGEPGDPSVPAGAALADAPTELTWSAAAGADAYDVYLDDRLVATVTEPRWTIDHTLSAGRHAWQVVARQGDAVTGSPRWTFTIGTPAPASAPGIRAGRRLRTTVTALTWTPSAGATIEDVYLDGHRVGTTGSGSVTLAEPITGGAHQWFVVSHNGLGTSTGPVWWFSTPASDLRHDVRPAGTWPRDVYTALTVGDAAVFASDGSGPQSVAVYDPATGKVSQPRVSLPSLYETVAIGTNVLFAGGYDHAGSGGVTDEVTSLDVLTGRVRSAKLSQARESIAGTTVGRTALFAGGTYSAGGGPWTDSDVVDLFDASSGRWSTATLSQAREVAAAVSVGGKAIFAGGTVLPPKVGDPDIPSDVVDLYDAATGAWSTARLSHPASQGLASAVVGSRAYFAGDGWMDVYDARTGRWATVAAPPELNGAPRDAVVVGRSIYFADGSGTYNAGGVSIFDTKTGRWTAATLSNTRQGVKLAAVGRKVLFIGGYDADVVDVLDTVTGQWSVQKLGETVYSATATTVGNTVVVPVDGFDSERTEVDVFTDPDTPARPSLSGSLSGALSAIAPGGSHDVRVTVRNTGGAALAGPFAVDVYLSKDGSTGAEAMLLGRAVIARPLPAAAAARVTVAVSVPKGVAVGAYRLVTGIRSLTGDVSVLDDRAVTIGQESGASYA